MTELPRIVEASDVPAGAGRHVEVFGVYTPIDLSRRPRPVYPDSFIAIRLADGEAVLLEPPWQPAARRSHAERDAYLGRVVRARGTLYASVPEQFEGAATPLMPCLVDVESVTIADAPDPR